MRLIGIYLVHLSTHLYIKSHFFSTPMSTWMSDPFGVPPWHEEPKCHCGRHVLLNTWAKHRTQHKYERGFFKGTDLDDDLKVSSNFCFPNLFFLTTITQLCRLLLSIGLHFLQFVDLAMPAWSQGFAQEVENEGNIVLGWISDVT